jgi:RHS repeat-associated protein
LTKATGREHAQNDISAREEGSDYPQELIQHQMPNNATALRNYAREWEYDEVGNIMSLIHIANGSAIWNRSYDYAQSSNQLMSTKVGNNAVNYTYNEHGSMTKMPHLQVMEWDFAERLSHVTKGSGSNAIDAYYSYGGSGERTRKVVEKNNGSIVETRLYLGRFEIWRKEVNGNIDEERETLHIMDDVKRIAIVETKTVDGGTKIANSISVQRYQLSNNIESATLELDEKAQIISYEEYYPYGDTSYQAGKNIAEVGMKRYRYTGKEKDEESGLYYYGARYYFLVTSAFISCDPHFEKYFWISPYVYCLDNPLNVIDSDGKDVHILYYTRGNTRGNSLFKAAAETRKKDIESKPNFDRSKDVVLIYDIKDISRVGTIAEHSAKVYEKKYGKTAEIGVFSHAGKEDGPIGTKKASRNPISSDPQQMSLEGWGSFDFNWKDKGASMKFYGCNTGNDEVGENGESFAKRLSGLNNMEGVDVLGQSDYSYQSFHPDVRVTNVSSGVLGKFDTDYPTYMVAGNSNESIKSIKTGYSPDIEPIDVPEAKPMNIYREGIKIGSEFQW